MSQQNPKNVLVTGGSGYIGVATVKQLLAAGHAVQVLTRSEAGAARVAAMGAVPVIGDILQPGVWQQTAAQAGAVIHLAQPETYGERITRQRAQAYRTQRQRMDSLLMQSLDRTRVRKILFITGTSYYGNLGRSLHDETATPNPCGWGPYLQDGVELADRYAAEGWPVVQAFPGYVYGNGSWYREYIALPLLKGAPLIRLMGRSRYCSPVHIDDCARALVHLLEHGEGGARYFIVDDKPSPYQDFYTLTAQALNVRRPALPVPPFLAKLAMGPVVGESLSGEAVLSNARLKSTGFVFDFPSLEQGVPAVVAQMRRR